MRILSSISGAVLLLLIAGHAQARLVQNTLDDFTLYAGSKLVTGNNVTINGHSGSASKMRLGRQNQINGDLFTHARLNIGNDAAITGNVITGDRLTIGSRSTTQSVSGRQNVNINKHAIVNGTLAYGNKLNIHPLAQIQSDISTDFSTWSLLPVSPLLPNLPEQIMQDNLLLPRSSELALSPGNYRKVRVANNSILYLSSGEYNFNNVVLGKNAQIIADTSEGNVTVNISRNLRSGKGAGLFSSLESQMTFNVGRNVVFGKSNQVFAMVNSVNNMRIGNGSIITGSFVAGNNLKLGKDLEVNTVKIATVPEPTTLVLLSGGLLSILARRRNLSRGCARR